MQTLPTLSSPANKIDSAALDSTHSPKASRVAALLILLGAALRLGFYMISDNCGGDAGAHAALAALWMKHPYPKVIFHTFPPGHFWLIGALSLVVHDVASAARLLSLVLGIASLFLVWKLARILYGDSAALLSLATFALYSIHIAYSTTSSAEVTYLFFALAAIMLFFAYFQEPGKLWYLAFSGLTLSAGESVRYEAWAVFGGLGLILAAFSLSNGGWKGWLRPVLTFGVTAGAWPAFMMSYCWRRYHDPLYQVHWSRGMVMQDLQWVPWSHQLAIMPVVLTLTLTPILIAAVVFGLAESFRSRIRSAFALLVLFFVLVVTYQLVSGGLLGLARYTITTGTLFAVVAGYGVQSMFQKLAPAWSRFALVAVVALLTLNLAVLLCVSEIPNAYADTFASVSPRLRYLTRIAEVGGYLKHHMTASDAVIIDDYRVESNVIAEAADLPILPGDRAYLAGVKSPVSPGEFLVTRHPRFLVYSDRGTLSTSLYVPAGCSERTAFVGITFRCVFANEIYRIFELSYP